MRSLAFVCLTALAVYSGGVSAADDIAGYLARLPAPPADMPAAIGKCADTSDWDSFNRRLDFTQRQQAQQALQSQTTLSMFNQDDRMAFSDYVNAATPETHDVQMMLKGPLVQGMPVFSLPVPRGENAAGDKQDYAALAVWLKQADAWWAGQSAKIKAIVTRSGTAFKPKHPEDTALVQGAAAQLLADRLSLLKQLADASRSICSTVMDNLPAEYQPGSQ